MSDDSSSTAGASPFERMARSIRSGNLDLFQEALGEYPGDPAQLLTTRDGAGATLVHLAAEYANPSLLELLLSLDPSVVKGLINQPTPTSERATPLHLAACPRFDDEPAAVQCVQLLLASGAVPKAKNGAGETAIEITPYSGVRAVLAKAVAVRGSDLALDDSDGDDE
ncbi:hypothetical protein BC828DRAFT_389253 [Blastocladiella britannica]|nr:hypothetical protein BC828DRAFT_389253 [Blastocladiella britannica]